MKLVWIDDTSQHKLVSEDGRETAVAGFTQITYLDGKVGCTDYYTGKGEMILTPDEYCQLIAVKEAVKDPLPLHSSQVPLHGVPYPKHEDCRIETPRECGCAFG